MSQPSDSTVIWAAIIGAGVAIFGVIINNIINCITNKTNLRHDAEQRDREREMSLRREVYLKAAEDFIRSQFLLVRYAQGQIDPEQWQSELMGVHESLGKIHVVGSNQTIALATEYLNTLTTVALSLVPRQIQLGELVGNISATNKAIDSTLYDQSRHTEIMKEYNLNGVVDKSRWDALQKQCDISKECFEKNHRKLDELNKERLTLTTRITGELLSHMPKINTLVNSAVRSIRKEMDLDFNFSEYEEQMIQANNQMREVVDKFNVELLSQEQS